MPEPDARSWLDSSPWPVRLTVLVGLALSVLAFVGVRHANETRLDERFERMVASLQTRADEKLQDELDVLYSVRDATRMGGPLSRREFHIVAQGELSRHPDIRALEWVPVVKAAERPAFEAAARRDGFTDFRLTDRDAAGKLVTAGPRDVYYPVFYVEPLEGNRPALGYAPVLPARDNAIEHARDTGELTASLAFPIIQSSHGRVGVAVFVPVYRAPEPTTLAERRERLEGLVEAIVVPEQMFGPLVAEAKSLGVVTTLVDEDAPPGERTLLTAPMVAGSSTLRRRDVPFDMGTRHWRLSFLLVDPRTLEGPAGLEWVVLAAGLLATGLVGGYLQRTVEQRARAERLVEERTAALAQAQALERMKNNFVDAVTHDLRTPLTSIRGYTELLEDEIGGQLTIQQHSYVKQIERGTARLSGLVDDLLDFARLDAGTFRLRCDPCNLAQAIRDVAVSLDPLVHEAGLTLLVPPEDATYEAPMDIARIERVLFNLLHNAIKFSREGGTITMAVQDDGECLRCEVRDEGLGIPAEQLPRLFQRFSQLQEGSAKGGTGLGLSIAKAIVEAHGGSIGVESTPGVGSTFWFTLPKQCEVPEA